MKAGGTSFAFTGSKKSPLFGIGKGLYCVVRKLFSLIIYILVVIAGWTAYHRYHESAQEPEAVQVISPRAKASSSTWLSLQQGTV